MKLNAKKLLGSYLAGVVVCTGAASGQAGGEDTTLFQHIAWLSGAGMEAGVKKGGELVPFEAWYTDLIADLTVVLETLIAEGLGPGDVENAQLAAVLSEYLRATGWTVRLELFTNPDTGEEDFVLQLGEEAAVNTGPDLLDWMQDPWQGDYQFFGDVYIGIPEKVLPNPSTWGGGCTQLACTLFVGCTMFSCTAGNCTNQGDCTAQLFCTAMACTYGTACTNGAGCTAGENTCTDGNRCTSGESCTGGIGCTGQDGQSGCTAAIVCTRGPRCTLGWDCTSGENCTNGGSCTAGEFCTGGVACTASSDCTYGECTSGPACTTGDGCTWGDPCTQALGCTNNLCTQAVGCSDGAGCTYGNSCTVSSSCTNETGCTNLGDNLCTIGLCSDMCAATYGGPNCLEQPRASASAAPADVLGGLASIVTPNSSGSSVAWVGLLGVTLVLRRRKL